MCGIVMVLQITVALVTKATVICFITYKYYSSQWFLSTVTIYPKYFNLPLTVSTFTKNLALSNILWS